MASRYEILLTCTSRLGKIYRAYRCVNLRASYVVFLFEGEHATLKSIPSLRW